MTESERIEGFERLIEAAKNDAESGVQDHPQIAWERRFAGGGFSFQTQEFINAIGQETARCVYKAAFNQIFNNL